MLKKRNLIFGVIAFAAVLIMGLTSYSLAASKIGQVTGKDGDIKDKVKVNAEVTKAEGSHLTIKDLDTGKEYRTGIGPSRFSGTYKVGDKIIIEGVETQGENAKNKDHNFQTMKINDKVLRENFEGKPAWAGQGNGTGQRNGQGQGQGKNFVDANGDGVCDNKK